MCVKSAPCSRSTNVEVVRVASTDLFSGCHSPLSSGEKEWSSHSSHADWVHPHVGAQ